MTLLYIFTNVSSYYRSIVGTVDHLLISIYSGAGNVVLYMHSSKIILSN